MAAPRSRATVMTVRFAKRAPDAPSDAVTCVRSDGTLAEGELPREGVLPSIAVRFVVEATLGWREGFFGRIAGGAPMDPSAGSAKVGRKPAAEPEVVRQAEALAECLQADQWGGASDPAEFARRLAAACRRRQVGRPVVTEADLVRVRGALREFGAAWRPLTPGGVVERRF